MKAIKVTVVLFLLAIPLQLSFTPTLAQDMSCPVIVETAWSAVDDECAPIGQQQACYGHSAIELRPQPGFESILFDQPGDLVDVTAIQSLRLSAMNEASGDWGVAQMRLRVSSALLTMLVFGDVELANAAPANSPVYAPMQAVYFNSGEAAPACEEMPADGLLVQTPEGVAEVSLLINEVNIHIGSTAYVTAKAGEPMTVYVVEGEVRAETDSGQSIAPAGTFLTIFLDDDFLAFGAPQAAASYQMVDVEDLPVQLLERLIEIADPFDGEFHNFEVVNETGCALDVSLAGMSGVVSAGGSYTFGVEAGTYDMVVTGDCGTGTDVSYIITKTIYNDGRVTITRTS